MSRSAGGITNLTTALTGERIVGLHRRLQILVHDSGGHDGLENGQRGAKMENGATQNMSGQTLYVYRPSLYMCASSQAVRCPTSRQQNVEGRSVGGGQV